MTNKPAPVPLCDVNAQYRTIKAEIDAAVGRVIESGLAINGPDVAAFEQEAAAYCGVDHAVGCADGTTALLLALTALDVGPGDEVILPPFTFFATLGSVLRVGAKPVFADIEPDTFNIDPVEIERKITDRTKAILPVHLFGQCADMTTINQMAADRGIAVIEDAAQSFGASVHGVRCGAMSTIGCFSFYPSKNLGTLGDGGMVTTNDAALAAKLKALRNHGSEVKYFHKYVGWNARLDTLHAAILRAKLPHVDGWLAARRAAADRYDSLITDAGLAGFFRRPITRPDRVHTFNQYTIRVAGDRDGLVKHLKENAIGCEIYYPLSLHLQECVRGMGFRSGDYPVSETASQSVLSLPMFPEITVEQQRRAVAVCAEYVERTVRRAA